MEDYRRQFKRDGSVRVVPKKGPIKRRVKKEAAVATAVAAVEAAHDAPAVQPGKDVRCSPGR